MRVLRIWPIGDVLDKYFRQLTDARDGGTVILTHQYLLIGMTLPLYLMTQQKQGEITYDDSLM